MSSPILIGSAPGGAPLGPQQKKFNTHVQRIAAQRELLAAWQAGVDAYRVRHAADFMPLLADHRALTREMALLLDAESGRKGLSKTDRATLADAVASLAGNLADRADDDAEREAMKALYNRHTGGDFDAEEAEGHAMAREVAREMAQDLFGIDLDGVDLDSPEAIARHVEAQMQAQQAQAEAARAAHQATRRAKKKPSARERQEQEAEQQASQSLRDIYRKLASSLHPDREPDPAERARKTALMQRANQAYAANNLLDLLQLQLEAEQIDPARIASLGEERLKHYNRVLAEQLAELQREVYATQQRFCAEFGLDPFRSYKPARLMTELRAQMQYLQQDMHDLRLQLRALREDPAELKIWLKHQRAAQREADMFAGF
ncbi:MAG: J domain-containing protein [Acidovorax sp.]|uniref:J domain-containing protein n=1 Tax=Acidovorax sp. TaxID=1872122 RepID=UPI0039E2BF15